MSNLHQWNLTPTEAVALQRELASRVDFSTPLDLDTVKIVAGVDVSVRDDVSTAAMVALSFPDMRVLDRVTAKRPTTFPYISGLLSFREIPVLLEAHAKLSVTPDVYMVDGMGRIHPRRIGIAAHLGLWLDAPTVGVGKTHFLGKYDEPPNQVVHGRLKHVRRTGTSLRKHLSHNLKTHRRILRVYRGTEQHDRLALALGDHHGIPLIPGEPPTRSDL